MKTFEKLLKNHTVDARLPHASKMKSTRTFKQRSFVPTKAAGLLLMHGLAAVALLFPSAWGVALLLLGWVFTGGLGISLGYHRLLSHSAFQTSRVFMRILSLFGSLACQGGPITWVAFHLAHHRRTDQNGDPHSAARGFWWSHMGWVCFKGPNGFHQRLERPFLKRLSDDKILSFLEQYHLFLSVSFAIIGTLLLGWQLALWAFPLRIVCVWHLTWLVNSYSHGAHHAKQGKVVSAAKQPVIALLNFGESLHGNHHKSPTSPCFSGSAMQFDSGFLLLKLLACCRLVSLQRGSRQ